MKRSIVLVCLGFAVAGCNSGVAPPAALAPAAVDPNGGYDEVVIDPDREAREPGYFCNRPEIRRVVMKYYPKAMSYPQGSEHRRLYLDSMDEQLASMIARLRDHPKEVCARVQTDEVQAAEERMEDQ